MLPTMQPFGNSRTAEVIRVGPLRLFFSFFRLIAFQVDGEAAVVCSETYNRRTTENHLRLLEPDQTKRLNHLAFTQKWLTVTKAVFQLKIGV